MAYHQVAILALLLCLSPACVKKAPEQEPAPPTKPVPGPKLLLEHEALSKELQCDRLKLPLLALEANTLSPERVAPGGEVHHRLTYAFCPTPGSGPEKGVLLRKLSLKGKVVFLDQDKNFVLTPGRSAVGRLLPGPGGRPARHVCFGGGLPGASSGSAQPQPPVLQRQGGPVHRHGAVNVPGGIQGLTGAEQQGRF